MLGQALDLFRSTAALIVVLDISRPPYVDDRSLDLLVSRDRADAPGDRGGPPRLGDQPEDGREMEAADIGCRCADWSKGAPVEGAVDRGRGRRGRVPPSYAPAPRRLPLRPPGHPPATHALIPAPLPSAPWDQPVAGGGRRQARQGQIQELSDRLLSYRHRRGSDGARQAPPVRRHRPPRRSSPLSNYTRRPPRASRAISFVISSQPCPIGCTRC